LNPEPERPTTDSPEHDSRRRFDVAFVVRLIVLAAFIGLGTKALLDQHLEVLADTGPRGWGAATTPQATTDAYFRAMLRDHEPTALEELRQPTEPLRAAIAALPAHGDLIFVGPEEDSSYVLTYLVTGYLAWPRSVYEAGCGRLPGQLVPPPSTRIAGIIYYLRPPPACLPPGRRVIPQTILVPVSENVSWDCYCSR